MKGAKFCSDKCRVIFMQDNSSVFKYCGFCQSSFVPKNVFQVYCSTECRYLANKGQFPVSYYKKCHCGNWYNAVNSWQQYCSDECRELTVSKKEIVSNIDREYYLERDNFVCQCCLSKFAMGKLDCHHILWLMLGGTDNDDNIVVLCRQCHHKQHVNDVFKALKKNPLNAKQILLKRFNVVRMELGIGGADGCL
jgi:predicted nucleic acid-binding Zn ribbon protein